MSEPDPYEVLRQQCVVWAQEAHECRVKGAAVVPPFGATPEAFYKALLEIRGYLDRLEGIMDAAQAMRASTARGAKDAAEAAEDAWGERAAALRAAGRRDDSFSSARERAAEATLATFPQQQEMRRLRGMAELAAEVESRIRSRYRGLDGTRQDVLGVLRYFGFESHLEH